MTAETAILLAVAIPLAGALGVALARRLPNLREAASLASSGALAAAAWSLLPEVMSGNRPAVEVFEFVPGLSIRFEVEPLGAMFAALASLLWIVSTVYSIGYMRGNAERHQTRYYVFFAIAISATMGVAFAGNLLTLFLFYEALTLATYPLVAHAGDERARRGARTYLFILLATSIGLLLPAIAWTWSVAGTLDFTPGGVLEGRITDGLAAVLLLLYVLGTGKAAVMPVHRWLPAAMVAPAPVSALLHAVAVVKAGVFTIAKVVIYVFGLDFLAGVPAERLLVWLAGFTVVAASIVAMRQTDLKRLLAYSTVSQLSYVVLAALVLAPLAEVGAAIHIVAHAFGKITLFFAAGAIYVASKKTDIGQMAGIGLRMPWTMTAFAIGALSMIGVPPTAGFVSKWYIIAGAFQLDNYFVLAVLIASTGLNAAYFLPIVFRAFFRREDRPPQKEHGEAPWPMVAALVFTASLVVVFFVFNGPVVDLEYGILRGRP
ncbi:MAG TPA: monovalent cation/H+ antiporter subunit D family protein [Steroidobacteraceae bacterium]|nr:monovalent cation/H+ antiporter subunit D family protein [Steroidobacteraceae bacterium]